MASNLEVVGSPSRRAWRGHWSLVRDLLGGVLLLASWVALWTVTWAAVAGPLRPAHAPRDEVTVVAPRS